MVYSDILSGIYSVAPVPPPHSFVSLWGPGRKNTPLSLKANKSTSSSNGFWTSKPTKASKELSVPRKMLKISKTCKNWEHKETTTGYNRYKTRGHSLARWPENLEAAVSTKWRKSKKHFWLTWYGYESIPIHTIFRGVNIHLPAILMFTRGTRFWHTAILPCSVSTKLNRHMVAHDQRLGCLFSPRLWSKNWPNICKTPKVPVAKTSRVGY